MMCKWLLRILSKCAHIMQSTTPITYPDLKYATFTISRNSKWLCCVQYIPIACYRWCIIYIWRGVMTADEIIISINDKDGRPLTHTVIPVSRGCVRAPDPRKAGLCLTPRRQWPTTSSSTITCSIHSKLLTKKTHSLWKHPTSPYSQQ